MDNIDVIHPTGLLENLFLQIFPSAKGSGSFTDEIRFYK